MRSDSSEKWRKTPKGDLDILAGISEAEQKRRDEILKAYELARKNEYRTASMDGIHITVVALGSIIGRGHHSNVYQSELEGSHTPVALKVDYRNLMDEYPRVWAKVKALRGIQNNHIQRFIEFVPDWEMGRSYMILEYIPGETLQKLLYDRRQSGGAAFPQGRVLDWAFQILDALEYLHMHGLLHGDINLSNIILRPKNVNKEEDICLIDFNWAAPDLAGGEARRDIQSPDAPEETFFKVENAEAFQRGIRRDIYHVGAVMYQLFTGEVPDPDRGRAQLIQEEKATDESEKRRNLQAHGVTDDVAEIILKSISVDPSNRYSSAERMRDALTKLPLTNRETDKKSKRRKISALSRLCAVLGALLILLGVYQLGAENGVKPEMSAQNETQVSDEALLPSTPDGDR